MNIDLFGPQSSEIITKLTCFVIPVEVLPGVFMEKGKSASAFRCSRTDKHFLFVKDGRGSLQVWINSVN